MPSLRTFARKVGTLVKTLVCRDQENCSSSSSSSIHDKLILKMEKAEIPTVRRGHVAMYVGDEGKRYEVPVDDLKFPALQELMMQSQDDDLESKINGPIVIACTTDKFDRVLKRAKEFHHHHHLHHS